MTQQQRETVALVARAQAGDQRAADELGRRHHDQAVNVARALRWTLPGADLEDVHQEALVGLMTAIRDYRPGGTTFHAFVNLCVRRQLVNALRSAKAVKHRPLNESVRQEEDEEGEMAPVTDLLPDRRGDTLELVEHRAHLAAIGHALHTRLTPLQRRAVLGRAAGLTHEEMGGRTVHSALAAGWRNLGAVA